MTPLETAQNKLDNADCSLRNLCDSVDALRAQADKAKIELQMSAECYPDISVARIEHAAKVGGMILALDHLEATDRYKAAVKLIQPLRDAIAKAKADELAAELAAEEKRQRLAAALAAAEEKAQNDPAVVKAREALAAL